MTTRASDRLQQSPAAMLAGCKLGLVCLSFNEEVRYRTITRTRFLTLSAAQRELTLLEIYWANLQKMHWALTFCQRQGIELYRVTSNLFPMADEPLGQQVLRSIAASLSSIGRRAERLGIRITIHPDQFVVLNSENPRVVQTSISILQKHALSFDLMGLPRTPWAAMTLHGGKSGRARELVATIRQLPESIRNRLVLENDEHAYGAQEILDICQEAQVPMIFDNHHHAVKERLDHYDDPSFARVVSGARGTWPNPQWQLAHLSNGKDSFGDPKHSDFITAVPEAYRHIPWIEVEARGKERAIAKLRDERPQ